MPILGDPEGVPKDTIAVWTGTISTIPSGWKLCDGTNGTPDLRTRFPRCVINGITNPGAIGGQATIVLTTAQLPFHNHSFSVPNHEHSGQTNAQAPTGSLVTIPLTGSTFSGEFLADISSSFLVSGMTSTGSDSGHENLPRCKDVLYIQKS